MKDLKQMTVDELKNRAQELCDAIYNLDCFATPDLQEYEAVLAELENRSITIVEQKVLAFPGATSGNVIISTN